MLHRFLITFLLLLLGLTLILPINALSPTGPTPSIAWSAYSNPSNNRDAAIGVCQTGEFIYVVGNDMVGGNMRQRIEMRSKNGGGLIKYWVSNPSEFDDSLIDCIVVSNKLIAVGVDISNNDESWVIAEFDLSLSLKRYISSRPSPWSDVVTSVISDGTFLYLVGWDSVPGDARWRVEKRRVSDLGLVALYTSNPSNYDDWATSIGINPLNGNIWIVGDNYLKGRWRIEILDQSFNLIQVIEPSSSGWARGIDFDEYGNAYVVGVGGVAKFDFRGSLIKFVIGYDCYRVLYSSGYVYVAAIEDGYKHILLVFDNNLNLLYKLNLSSTNIYSYFTDIGKMAYDGSYLYVAGIDKAEDEGRWVIYAIGFSYSSQTITTTVTITQTTVKTVTATETKTELITITLPPVTHITTVFYVTTYTPPPITEVTTTTDYITELKTVTQHTTITTAIIETKTEFESKTITAFVPTTITEEKLISTTITIGFTAKYTEEKTVKQTFTEIRTIISRLNIYETITSTVTSVVSEVTGISPMSLAISMIILAFGVVYSSKRIK